MNKVKELDNSNGLIVFQIWQLTFKVNKEPPPKQGPQSQHSSVDEISFVVDPIACLLRLGRNLQVAEAK